MNTEPSGNEVAIVWILYLSIGLFITGYVRRNFSRDWLENSKDDEIVVFYLVTFALWPGFLAFHVWQYFTKPVEKEK